MLHLIVMLLSGRGRYCLEVRDGGGSLLYTHRFGEMVAALQQAEQEVLTGHQVKLVVKSQPSTTDRAAVMDDLD